jgi:hypothetical protein
MGANHAIRPSHLFKPRAGRFVVLVLRFIEYGHNQALFMA